MKLVSAHKILDFSDYPKESKLFDPGNKQVIGKMKDEVKGKIINSLVIVNNEETKKAKGVNKNVAKNVGIKNMLFCLIKR